MARDLFSVEKGLRITDLNECSGLDILKGSAVPGGDAGAQDDAAIGSLYLRENGELYKKIADTNAPSDWSALADDLLSGYTPVNGDPANGDTLQEAIEKLDGNQDDIQDLTGASQGETDYGTMFTGSIIPDNSNIKESLQALETEIESLSGGSLDTASAVTTATNVSCINVDDAFAAEWEVTLEDAATPANKKFFKVAALHDGTSSADAANVDDTIFAKLCIGADFNHSLNVVLTGTGASQQMCIEVASTEPGGVNVRARKTSV